MRFASSTLVIALLSCGLWLGCSSDDTAPAGPSTSDKDAGKSDASTSASKDSGTPVDLQPFRIVGRVDDRDTAGPRFGWSGTQVIAKFTGETISVDLGDTSGEDQFDVSIDGKAPTLLKLDTSEKKTYELATGLSAGEHTLVLTKRTEALIGEVQLFKINATLVGTPPPASVARRFEIVGDSITAGYGVLGADENCSFSADTEDESLAWGGLAAKELDAAHTAIAWSGIGLVEDYDGSKDNQMPERYDRALASDAASTWDHKQFEPEVVVVALGTNDLSRGQEGESFEETLVTFLETIRTTHPNANIVLATSPLLEGEPRTKQKTFFEGAIATRKGAGDQKLTLLDIPSVTGDEGYGCDFHPSRATQKRMATALVAHLKTLTNW